MDRSIQLNTEPIQLLVYSFREVKKSEDKANLIFEVVY